MSGVLQNIASSSLSGIRHATRRLHQTLPLFVSRRRLLWLPGTLTSAALLVVFLVSMSAVVLVRHQQTFVDDPSTTLRQRHGLHRFARAAAATAAANDNVTTDELGVSVTGSPSTNATADDPAVLTPSTITASFIEVVTDPTSMTSSSLSWPPTSGSTMTFKSYGGGLVDLRIIVLTYNRPESLRQCLEALNEAKYFADDRVSVHVWIDGRRFGDVDVDEDDLRNKTIAVADGFNFTHGSYRVHVRHTHVGVQGQWMTSWRPVLDDRGRHREVALIVEDDITVSPFYWRWLRAAHRAYGDRDDVSGFSVSHPEMQHATGSSLEVPINYTVFMYPVICTWGFSPRPVSWIQFQDWFFEQFTANSSKRVVNGNISTTSSSSSSSEVPLVDGILPTEWYISERRQGRETNLWEQWHIYFTNARRQYTLMANPGSRVGFLAVNRHERGLHDGQFLAVNRHERGLHDGQNGVVGATQPLATEWSQRFDDLPEVVIKLGYDGVPLLAPPEGNLTNY